MIKVFRIIISSEKELSSKLLGDLCEDWKYRIHGPIPGINEAWGNKYGSYAEVFQEALNVLFEHFALNGFIIASLQETDSPYPNQKHYLVVVQEATGPLLEKLLESVGLALKNACGKVGVDVKKEFGTDDPLELGRMIQTWIDK